MQIQAEIEDSTHLKLRQPLDAKVGSVIVLEIIDPSERDEFAAGSVALLERAYGEEEPDYSKSGKPI